MTILSVNKLKKQYGTKKSKILNALNNVNFDIKKGEFIAIMGASGSGKTTLLNCIATIDTATEGSILLEDIDITKLKQKDCAEFRRNNLGFIFQDFHLLDHLTVEENIALALSINDVDSKIITEKVNNIAKQLGIEEILNKYPYETSGGQKQRCACARALITNPKLVLADEPTGALDSATSQMFLETLEDMNKRLKTTILMVTHDGYSASYANKVLVLKDGKIFTEIQRKEKSRSEFFDDILKVLGVLGGKNETVKTN